MSVSVSTYRENDHWIALVEWRDDPADESGGGQEAVGATEVAALTALATELAEECAHYLAAIAGLTGFPSEEEGGDE